VSAFFDALISFHEQVFDSAKPATPDASNEPTASPASAASSTTSAGVAGGFWIVDDEAADSGFLDDDLGLVQPAPAPLAHSADQAIWTVDSLNTGTWVDLALAGTWVRAQLTWASPQRTLFMFISGAGMAHSMSRKTLERLKKSRLIRTVSNGRVLDNALDAVAKVALRNDLQAPPPKPRK
jgi:hypothetical protein